MQRTVLIVSAILFGTLLQAQTKTDLATVNWGPQLDAKKDGQFQSVIDDKGDAIYQLMSKKHDLFVQRMDPGLHVIYQKPLDLKLEKKDLSLEAILLLGDNVVVFSSIYDKKQDENQLYAATYSQSDFSPMKRNTKIATIPAEKARNKGSFTIVASPDKSKVLVYMNKPADKGENDRFGMQVYDMDMEQLWAQDVTLPYPDEEFSTKQILLDNDGTVVGLGTRYAEKSEKRELKRAGNATYENHILVVTKDSPVPQDHPISVTGKFLQDMTLSIGKNGNIICGGLFSNKDAWSIRGTYFISLDPTTKEVAHESYKDFSDNFITQYMTEKESKKATKKANKKGEEMELPDYYLHDIIHRDDGGAVMVAEQHREYQVCTTDAKGNTYCTMHYVYNDIIVVNIDPEGNIEWASKIPKRQHSVNDGGLYSSCAVEVKGDKIYFIFNDSGENLFVKPGDKIQQFELKGKDALVVLATVDAEGNVQREALFSPERRGAILRPKDCVELSNDDMFIYASRKKEYRFGEVSFK